MISPEELRYYSMPKLQKLFRKNMGEWELGDHYYDPIKKTVNVVTFHDKLTIYRDMDIFLPLPIDPENPERGLLGMLNNFWDLYTLPELEINKWKVVIKSGMTFNADTSTLALLKALAAQEGVEI